MRQHTSISGSASFLGQLSLVRGSELNVLASPSGRISIAVSFLYLSSGRSCFLDSERITLDQEEPDSLGSLNSCRQRWSRPKRRKVRNPCPFSNSTKEPACFSANGLQMASTS